jgi:hypothetical protein
VVNRPYLFDDFERGPLTVTRRGAVQYGANRMNGLPVATNDAANVALTQLHFEDCHLAARNFRQHHVVGKFDELSNNELEKFLHVDSGAGGGGGVSAGAAAGAGAVSTGAGAGAGLDAAAAAAFFAAAAASFFAAASGFLVFLIKLRTVSDG